MGEPFGSSLGDAFLADPLTPSASRQAHCGVDPLRTLPFTASALLAALAAESDDALLIRGAHEQAEQILALVRFEEMLSAQLLRRIAVFDRSGGASAVRSRSTKGFLRTHAQLAEGHANRLVSLARWLDRLPAVSGALAVGALSADQVEVISREISPVEDADARHAAEELLVEQAPRLHLTHLRQAARQIHAHLVAEEEPPVDALPPAFQSWVRLSPTGTSDNPFWVLSGELSPLAGEKLRVALEAAAGVPAEGDPRSSAERLGDALESVTDLALRADRLPTTGAQRPHLTLIADLEALRPGCRVHPASGSAAESKESEELSGLLRPRAACTTARGHQLPAWQARKESCDCRLRVILTRRQGEPLSVGRATRTVPAALRDAVVARDRHCVWPGCDRPPTWCEAHHMIHWADGGRTSLDNLALLCGEHHTDLHRTGWALALRDGRPVAVPPPGGTPLPNSRFPQW
ncbi:HNH endonuclease signature motif containing protein [Streptacidiphilus jiangxiensis]|uniref:HNH endonuclease n=1 Tax=Streptacidiphilus jiangxiensis TaxID=235985 RepID=A0A1H7N7I4_STRJI|nr:HNH endonuclease signature motif containing protein [Streptacidiphilus jiangxiensis]SEL19440.1 HNH endonuclease [Streptacidiphilus jiangxiensis]